MLSSVISPFAVHGVDEPPSVPCVGAGVPPLLPQAVNVSAISEDSRIAHTFFMNSLLSFLYSLKLIRVSLQRSQRCTQAKTELDDSLSYLFQTLLCVKHSNMLSL